MNKSFYYCHGPAIIGSYPRTWFIEHHNCISLRSVDWCVSLLSINYFTCWKKITCVLPDFLIPHCSNPSVCYAWKVYLVLLVLSFLMHVMISLSGSSDVLDIFMSITGFLSKFMIWCKKKHFCYLELIIFKRIFIWFFRQRKVHWVK